MMERSNWANYPQLRDPEHGNRQFRPKGEEAWVKKKEGKKKKMGQDSKYASAKLYAREILKSSLITSIPEITVTKSWTKKIIKILVFIVCVIGFVYQTLNFLDLYLSYPTVVNVLISNPFEIVQPAVTICNRNRKRRSFVCSAENEDNECSFMHEETYCKLYKRNCPSYETPFTGLPFLNSMIDSTYSWDLQKRQSHNASMIHVCKKTSEGKTVKCALPYRPVEAVMSSGEPNFCYAIESLWEKPDEEPEIYPNTFSFEFEFKTQPDEYIVYSEPILIQIAVHDRRRLVSPYAEGYSLKGGVQYEATVSMTEKKLLPAPYDTNCTDYLKLWKENGGKGPLNDLMCIEHCKMTSLLKQGKCIDKDVAYPNQEAICKRGETTTTSDIIENCTKSCGSPCNDYTYEVRYEQINNFDHVCGDDYCKVATIKLTMYFKQFRLTKFQYQPKFESVEMFSYIGCYMGMWLGLSLISLFDFIETISYFLYFPIGRFRWNMEKKKSSLTAFRRNSYYRSQVY